MSIGCSLPNLSEFCYKLSGIAWTCDQRCSQEFDYLLEPCATQFSAYVLFSFFFADCFIRQIFSFECLHLSICGTKRDNFPCINSRTLWFSVSPKQFGKWLSPPLLVFVVLELLLLYLPELAFCCNTYNTWRLVLGVGWFLLFCIINLLADTLHFLIVENCFRYIF